MKKKRMYAVAATFIKDLATSNDKTYGANVLGLNVQTHIRKYKADSADEAVGMFVREMFNDLPDHYIHCRPVVVSV